MYKIKSFNKHHVFLEICCYCDLPTPAAAPLIQFVFKDMLLLRSLLTPAAASLSQRENKDLY